MGLRDLDLIIFLKINLLISQISDNAISRELLITSEGRKKMGEALKHELVSWLEEKENK